jgi:hypothetical protein
VHITPEAVLSVVPVEGQSLGKDVGSAAPQYKFSMSTPSISVGIMESLADDVWSTGDEFVVCEEQPEFDDSSGAVEVLCITFRSSTLITPALDSCL